MKNKPVFLYAATAPAATHAGFATFLKNQTAIANRTYTMLDFFFLCHPNTKQYNHITNKKSSFHVGKVSPQNLAVCYIYEINQKRVLMPRGELESPTSRFGVGGIEHQIKPPDFPECVVISLANASSLIGFSPMSRAL